MNIFKTIAATVYNPEFYEEAKHHTLGKVIGYYAKISLILGALAFIFGLITIAPEVKVVLAKISDGVYSVYPENLVVKISGGKVSTNAPSEPVLLALPENIKKEIREDDKDFKNNLVVINTTASTTVSIDEFKALDTYLFVGKDYIVTYDKNNSISFKDLSKVPDFTLDKTLINKMISVGRFLWIALPILFFVGIFIVTFLSLIFFIIFALVLWLVARLIGRKLTYAESYNISVYASTVPVILLFVLSPILPGIPFLESLLTLLVAIMNLSPKTPVEEPSLGA